MKIKFNKPICFYDLETTGLDVGKDRIVSISVLKIFPDGSQQSKSTYINPEINIPKEASEVHGITDDMVADKPTFKKIAKSLYAFMSDSDLAGFNNINYDDQLLAEEFLRCGIDFPTIDTKSMDVCVMFKMMEGRSLKDAVRFYLQRDFDEDAHDSSKDTKATFDVFEQMVEKYDEFKDKDVDFFSKIGNKDNRAEISGRIVFDADGDYCWNFSKEKGKKIKDSKSLADWIYKNDFPAVFKARLREIMTKLDEPNEMNLF